MKFRARRKTMSGKEALIKLLKKQKQVGKDPIQELLKNMLEWLKPLEYDGHIELAVGWVGKICTYIIITCINGKLVFVGPESLASSFVTVSCGYKKKLLLLDNDGNHKFIARREGGADINKTLTEDSFFELLSYMLE
jgi:hypothetical protein